MPSWSMLVFGPPPGGGAATVAGPGAVGVPGAGPGAAEGGGPGAAPREGPGVGVGPGGAPGSAPVTPAHAAQPAIIRPAATSRVATAADLNPMGSRLPGWTANFESLDHQPVTTRPLSLHARRASMSPATVV